MTSRRPLTITMRSCTPLEPMVVLEVAGPSGRFLPAAFRIDTGSSHSLITKSLATAIGIKAPKEPSTLTTLAGPLAYFPCRLHVGMRADDRGPQIFLTVNGGYADLPANLLGRDFLRHFDFRWHNDTLWLSLGPEGDQQ